MIDSPTTDARISLPVDRPLKVVFLLPTFDIGGAERVVLRTTSGLNRSRFEPVVVAFRAGSQRLLHELRARGVSAVDLGGASSRSPAAVWRLVRWLREYRCDVLMSYMFHANLASRLLRSFSRVPRLICSERVVEWETPVRVALNRATVRLADAITTNSQAGVNFWASRLGVEPSKIHLIYNGVDTTVFRPREQGSEASAASAARAAGEPIVIGNLGRLHHKSGQRHLLAALRRLAGDASLPPWRCVIAGDGPEAQSLSDLAARLGLSSRVQFVGHEDAPDRFLRSLDIYVQPSTAEGLPNAVLEAMATGLPVVATAVGGTPEVVDHGVTGWLAPSGDDAAIAGYLTRLVTDSAENAAMGRAGRLRVEARFSLLRMVQQTETLLDEVAAGPSARAGVRGTR